MDESPWEGDSDVSQPIEETYAPAQLQPTRSYLRWRWARPAPDRIVGGPNADQLFGGTGVDFLFGNGGEDQLFRADGSGFVV